MFASMGEGKSSREAHITQGMYKSTDFQNRLVDGLSESLVSLKKASCPQAPNRCFS